MLTAFGDATVFGERVGDGPVQVVFLHGWARSSQDFHAVSSLLLAGGISSVAFDLAGFGASPAPTTAGGAREYAAQMAPIVASVATKRVVLVGHSFGGRVAVVLAATHPELVRGLVLTAAPLVRTSPARQPSLSYRIVRSLHAHGVVSLARIERYRQQHGSADYRAARGIIRDVLVLTVGETYEKELAEWVGPTQLVWGDSDHDVPLEVAEKIRTAVSGPCGLTVVAGAGHFVPTEAPSSLAQAAQGLL